MEGSKKGLNKKTLIIGIVSLLLVIALVLGGWLLYNKYLDSKEPEETAKVATATPLLYEVTKDGEETKIYLFGSIHAADERAYPMQDKIMEAFDNSEYLAVEADIVEFQKDLQAQMDMVQLFLCENGKTLKDYLSEESYDIIIEYMKDNDIYNSAYEMYRPSMLYSLISNVNVDKSKLDADSGIDTYFLKRAKKNNKEILEVESVEEQYKLLTSMPDELYEIMILSFIENEEEEVRALKEMYEAWLSGDIDKLLETMSSDEIDIDELKKDLTPEEQLQLDQVLDMVEKFNESLINERNGGMTTVVDNYFKEGKNVFVVVGEAHVIGEDGLVKELSELGYKVELIEYK